MVDPGPLRPPRLVAEALGTGEIPSKLYLILVSRFLMVHEDKAALPSDKRSGQGIHSLLEQLASGGETYPRPGPGDPSKGRPIWNGESLALTIISPGQPLLDQPTSICLSGRVA